MIKSKLKKLKSMHIVCIALVAILSITGIIATLVTGDRTDNVFTVGKVKVELTEPNWKPDYDSDGDGINDTLRNIIPSQEIDKDPTLTNVGNNDAFVYLMIEIPKAYNVDLHTLKGKKINKSFCPLFSFSSNQGWELVDSQIASEDNRYENEAYDYYLYGYSQPLKKDESVTLFDKVTFANITSEYADLFNILGLKIKVKGYAIQSDFYGTEEIDAAKAWQKFVNQNNWSWPHEDLEKVVGLKYVNENKELIYAEALKPNEEIDLYFDSSLARNGYTFDWVDVSTGEVANNGMAMPDSNMTLQATYTETGYGSDGSGFITYSVEKSNDGDLYLNVTGLDETNDEYPITPSTVIVPTSVTFSMPNTMISDDNGYLNETSIRSLFTLDDSLQEYTLPVESVSDYAFSENNIIRILVLPDSIKTLGASALSYCTELKKVFLPYGITEIKGYTLDGCTNLLTLKVPNRVSTIKDYAFYDCGSLYSVTIPGSVTNIGKDVFRYCSTLADTYYTGDIKSWCNISFYDTFSSPVNYGHNFYINNKLVTELIIPETVNEIKDYTFYGFRRITSVTLSDSITTIGDSAFSDCTGLNNVYYDGSIENWCNITFEDATSNPMNFYAENFYVNNTLIKEIIIPDAVTKIKDYTFYGFDQITSVSLHSSVVSIGTSAFSSCTGLTSIVIPNSVKNIGTEAFRSCVNLTSITLGDNVTTLGSYVFRFCTNLASITIGKKVSTIDGTCFDGCISITEYIVHNENATYSTDKFGVLYNKNKTKLISHPAGNKRTSFDIPDSVKAIDASAFSDCTNLTSVNIPDSVTSIGKSAFEGCSSLLSITIPDSVTDLGESSFSGCSNLNSFVIGKGITCIDYLTFRGCTNLTSITIPNSVTMIYDYAFDGCNKLNYVAYSGTETEWGKITIKYKNDSVKNATKFYETTNVVIKEIDNLVYALSENSAMIVAYTGTATSVDILSEVNGVPVTAIGKSAFKNFSNLTSITIPDSIIKIESDAFSGCTALTSVTIGKKVSTIGSSAFYNCKNLENIYYTGNIKDWCNINFSSNRSNPMYYAPNFYLNNTLINDFVIPDTATIIKQYAFIKFTGIKSVTIGNGVKKIEGSAFEDCTKLEIVKLGNNITTIGDNAFDGCKKITSIIIPNSVTSIDDSAFSNCTNLQSITIPDSVTNIGDSAFKKCTALATITIPNNITSISDDMFSGCVRLVSVTLPDTIENIGDYAFEGCIKLESITIPNNVTSIGKCAFEGCTMLNSINIPSKVTVVGISAFNNTAFYNNEANWKNSALYIDNCLIKVNQSITGNLIIEDGTRLIADYAFQNCTSLTSVTIPKSITDVGYYAFGGCNALTDVYYKGTANEWAYVIIEDKNTILTSANIHFNS